MHTFTLFAGFPLKIFRIMTFIITASVPKFLFCSQGFH